MIWCLNTLILPFTLWALAFRSVLGISVSQQLGFEEFINSHELAVVNFCVNWTAPCKDLAFEFETASTILSERQIQFAEVDCIEEIELCKSYDIISYPSIKIFRGLERVTRYRGARKAEIMASILLKHSLPTITELDHSNIQDFKSLDAAILVAYLDPNDLAQSDIFGIVADNLGDSFLIGKTFSLELAEADQVTVPSIVLYKSFGKTRSKLSGSFDQKLINEFIKTNMESSIAEVNYPSFVEYFEASIESKIPLGYIVAEGQSERSYLQVLLNHVADKYKSSITVITGDTEVFKWIWADRNIAINRLPAVIIHDTMADQLFAYTLSSIAADEIDTFVQEFLDQGPVPQHVPSLPKDATRPITEVQVQEITYIEFSVTYQDTNRDEL